MLVLSYGIKLILKSQSWRENVKSSSLLRNGVMDVILKRDRNLGNTNGIST